MTLPAPLGRAVRLAGVAVATALAAGCGDSGTTGPDVDVASIRVTPENATTDVGLTVQFVAQAFDAEGGVIPNVTFAWSSSDESVATISDEGIATALAAGTTAITASAGAATPASEVLIVEPGQCDGRVDVVLAPGEFQTYAGDTCLLLPAGGVGDRYRIAITRPKLIQDPQDVPDVALHVDPILVAEQAASRPAGPSGFDVASVASSYAGLSPDAPRLDGTRFLEDRRVMEATRRFHAEMRRREAELGLRVRAELPTEPARALGPARVDPPARDDLFLTLECSVTASPTPVVLVDFNDRLAIYQDSVGHAAAPLSPSSTGLMLEYWTNNVQDLIDQYWGTTPDVDGNGRIILTTSDALPDSAAAAVFSGDFRSTSGCVSSNQGEVMYFATDVIAAMDDAEPSYLALGVLAHEAKHVTSLYHAVAREARYGPGTGFHDIWIEEGTAEVSQTMSSRLAWAGIGGPAIGARITGNDIIQTVIDNNQEVPPELWGVVSQIADLIVHLYSQPNSLITNPAGAAEFHTFYAGGWHWHRFIGDAFGNAATPLGDAPLFTEMTDSLTRAGVQALQAVTGRAFTQLFEDLTVAMAFHDAGPEPALAFTTWDLSSSTAIFAGPAEIAPPGRYPWPVTTNLVTDNPAASFGQAAVYSCPAQLDGDTYVPPAASQRCPIGPAGIRFHELVSQGSGAGVQVRATGVPDGTVTVVRVN